MDLLVGFAAGIVASIVSWYLILVLFTPRLAVSQLNRIPQDMSLHPCGFRYRVKIQNRSRLYEVSDVSLHARIVIRGLDRSRPHVQSSFFVPVAQTAVFPVLSRRNLRSAPELFERVYTLRIHELGGAARDRLQSLQSDMLERLEARKATVEEILGLGSDACIYLSVTCSHGRSGFRRTYSQIFRAKDIVEGEFIEPGVEVRR